MPLPSYTTVVATTLPYWVNSGSATNYAILVPAVSVLSIIASVIFVFVWQTGRVVFTRMAAKIAGRDLD
jgi:hypothetical protein